jgi:diadenosine tetraphosphate (Ap4A) HIT family hydrolase
LQSPDQAFALHPQLAADCFVVGDIKLCRLLMINDAQYPWFLLVPRRAGIREIYELDTADQIQLQQESVYLGRRLMPLFGGNKLNVAALGNVVPQLHVHHIVRKTDDAAWPAPVWGRAPAKPYALHAQAERIALVRAALGDWLRDASDSSNAR